MTKEELKMRTLIRESDVIDKTDGSELAKAFNHLWEKYVEQESCVTMKKLSDDELKHLEEQMKKEKWQLISMKQEPKIDVLDKIREEIEEQVLESLSDGGDDWFTAEKVNECLDIIGKYIESEGKE